MQNQTCLGKIFVHLIMSVSFSHFPLKHSRLQHNPFFGPCRSFAPSFSHGESNMDCGVLGDNEFLMLCSECPSSRNKQRVTSLWRKVFFFRLPNFIRNEQRAAFRKSFYSFLWLGQRFYCQFCFFERTSSRKKTLQLTDKGLSHLAGIGRDKKQKEEM